MRMPRTMRALTGWLALPLVLVASAFAQSDRDRMAPLHDTVAEQEGAVYGRLRFLEGGMALRRDSTITTDLVVNDPVAPGDGLTTDGDGRAEIQLADGSNIKLDFDSELVMQSLSDSSNQIENTTILQIGGGSIVVRAENMDSKEKRFQIDADSASIFLLSDGVFRIDVHPDGTTVVSSRRGVAEVMAQEISSLVRSGERITVRPGQIPGEARVFNTRMIDDFDAWSNARDEALVHRARVDDEVPVGLPEPVEPYSDELSYYGHWYNNPSYGWIWRPVGLGPDWQPYMYGHWGHSPTGLVWVSYEPWGWAPFHYGRWEFLLGTGWVWIPGHVFSGAYVAWGVSPGYFGWCPLGYYDYPVAYSLNIGFHRSPWVYVGAQHIFTRRLQTVVVRDRNVVRDIENKRLIVRGHPDIDPRRLREAPRVSQELYSVANTRRDLRLEPATTGRRLPFRENERQKLVDLNNRRLREGEVSRGSTVGRGLADRPVSVVPTDRRVNVPGGRGATSQPGRPARAGVPSDRPARAGEPRGVRGRTTVPESGGQHVAPRREQQPGGRTLPERVLPRIIPRSGSSDDPAKRPSQTPSRGAVRRQEPQDRPAAPSRTVQPQGRPGQGPSARPQQQPRQQQRQQPPRQVRSNAAGKKDGGKGGDKPNKD